MKRRLILLVAVLIAIGAVASAIPNRAMAKPPMAYGQYQLDIYTSDVKRGGTDGIIDLKFFGTKGSHEFWNVGECFSGNQFERNQVDYLVLLGNYCGGYAGDLGVITKVEVKNINAFIFDDDWHLGWIKIYQSGGPVYTCSYNNWIDGKPDSFSSPVTINCYP